MISNGISKSVYDRRQKMWIVVSLPDDPGDDDVGVEDMLPHRLALFCRYWYNFEWYSWDMTGGVEGDQWYLLSRGMFGLLKLFREFARILRRSKERKNRSKRGKSQWVFGSRKRESQEVLRRRGERWIQIYRSQEGEKERTAIGYLDTPFSATLSFSLSLSLLSLFTLSTLVVTCPFFCDHSPRTSDSNRMIRLAMFSIVWRIKAWWSNREKGDEKQFASSCFAGMKHMVS